MSMLGTLAGAARARVAKAKAIDSLESLRQQVLALPRGGDRLRAALGAAGLSLICEVKRASPSKGLIAPDFPYLDIAADYEAGGAEAISVLTEPQYFLGSDQYLRDIRARVGLPLLRKDFTVDEYQLYEARLLGADAVLLIAALLDTATLARYLGVCAELGLSALVEAHDAAEVTSALSAGAAIVGVNNRDLRTFEVDLNTCLRLRDLVPPGLAYVAESGISTAEDLSRLRQAGVGGALIGEALMRAADRRAALATLREACI